MLAGAAIGGTLGYAWGNHGNDLNNTISSYLLFSSLVKSF